MDRATLLDADVLWLLELDFAGRVYRWASRPVDIVTATGVSIPFLGGLGAIDVADVLAGLAEDATSPSVGIAVDWPAPGVAVLIADGQDLATASASVSAWVTGTTYEDRRRMLTGDIERPHYGGVGERVAFTLSASPTGDGAIVPDIGSVVDSSTWPSADEGEQGKVGPLVYGTPGGSTYGASPAYAVEVDGTPDVETLLVNDSPTLASSVTVHYDAGSEVFSVVTQDDSSGTPRMVADITGATDTSLKDATAWSVGWHSGGATIGTDGTTPAVLGAVIEWLLGFSTLSVDAGRWAAARPALDRYTVGGFIDDATSPWAYIVDNLLPLAPVSLATGPDGVYPIVWRLDATATDARRHIAVGGGVYRVGPVKYSRGLDDIITSVRVRWGLDGLTGNHRETTTIRPTAAGPATHRSGIAEAAYARVGSERILDLESDVIHDALTAFRVALWHLQEAGQSPRLLVYQCPPDFGELRAGDIVTVTDADVSIADAVALVTSAGAPQSDGVEIELRLLG